MATLLLFLHCAGPTAAPPSRPDLDEQLDSLFTKRDLNGSVLLYDGRDGSYHTNDPEWKPDGALPASTFKIFNTIVGLETGQVSDRSHPFEWDGVERGNADWNRNLTLGEAFAHSCVPCYQGLARRIGADSMNRYLRLLDYADFTVSTDSIDLFWLLGSARITKRRQIDFLRRLHDRELPLRADTYREMAAIMHRPLPDASYELYGKTGWSVDRGHDNGWFVGYAEYPKRTVYVAVNVEPRGELDREVFLNGRIDIALEALEALELLVGGAPVPSE